MIIYKATNKLNGKCYIGQTIKNLGTRKYQHLHSYKTPFHKVLKGNEENFEWKILCKCCSIQELNEMEVYYQKYFNSIWPNGYNMIEGDSGITHYNTRKKLSKSMIGNSNGRKKYLIITPEKDHVIIENLKEYCNNANINYCKMTYVANGRRVHHKGYICKKLNDIDINSQELKSIKFGRNTSGYILISPNGEDFKINDLTSFCKKHSGLNRYGFIRRLKYNSNKPYKGWIIKRIGEYKK